MPREVKPPAFQCICVANVLNDAPDVNKRLQPVRFGCLNQTIAGGAGVGAFDESANNHAFLPTAKAE